MPLIPTAADPWLTPNPMDFALIVAVAFVTFVVIGVAISLQQRRSAANPGGEPSRDLRRRALELEQLPRE